MPARPPEQTSWAGCEHPGSGVHSGTLSWGRDLGGLFRVSAKPPEQNLVPALVSSFPAFQEAEKQGWRSFQRELSARGRHWGHLAESP